nr:kinesin-like protein KIF14 [Chelonoidis abingdonii]
MDCHDENLKELSETFSESQVIQPSGNVRPMSDGSSTMDLCCENRGSCGHVKEKWRTSSKGGSSGQNSAISVAVRVRPLIQSNIVPLPYPPRYVVGSLADVQTWLELGNKQRAVAATSMNERSSRSPQQNLISSVALQKEHLEGEAHDHMVVSHMNLVDLSGSERCNLAQTSALRTQEGASINKSLLTLGKVISALSETSQFKRKCFIPYRDSVLTWLLKESLGDNSKTAMIATISPTAAHVEETLSTLRYASQARSIVNVVKVNEDSSAVLIRELKAEIEKLRAALQCSQGIDVLKYEASLQEIQYLKEQLAEPERELAESQKSWQVKLALAEHKMEEEQELQKAGVCFKVDNHLTNLVNLNEDPQLSEMLLYILKEGETRVGSLHPDSEHDIQLTGALISVGHCVITNVQGVVTLSPIPDARTFVNGNFLAEAVTLHHRNRVILGGSHYFRFNHPMEVKNGRHASLMPAGGADGLRDFEFAKNELVEAQKQRIEMEVEEARRQAQKEMVEELQMAKELAQQELWAQRRLYKDHIKQLEEQLEDETNKKLLSRRKAADELLVHLPALAQTQDTQQKRSKFLDLLEQEKEKLTEEMELLQQMLVTKEQERKIVSAESMTYQL